MANLRTYEEVRRDLLDCTPVQFCIDLNIIEGLIGDKGFKSLRECLLTPITKGGIGLPLDKVKEMLYFNPAYKHKADMLADKIGLIELAKDTDVLGDVGDNQYAGSKTEIATSKDRGSKYRIAKLKRDNPVVAQRLMDGEFKSVSEAERAAGLSRPLLSNVEKVKRAYDRLSDDEKSEFDLLL